MNLFEFAFSRRYRLAALPFGVTPRTAYVAIGDGDDPLLRVRFGPWSLRTRVSNVVSVDPSGPYAFVKTAGPAHLSFADRGVTFATNGERGVCLTFQQPVPAIDPMGKIKHPGATVTVRDTAGLVRALGH
jgi:hypothetical protein